jgi:hypothetical protein
MRAKALRRLAVVAFSVVILVLAFAPAAFAGGCDSDEEDCGGGGDSGAAAGGVSTGIGGMASDAGSDVLLTFALASGGILLMTAGGLAVRRQNR